MKRKIISLVAIFAIAFSLVAATLAYFTDKDEVTNVFTVGDVAVAIHEDNGIDIEDENKEDDVDYLENEPYRNWLKDQVLLPGESNGLPKQVHFNNTGNNDIYIRARLIIPADVYELITLKFTEATVDKWLDQKVETEDGDVIITALYKDIVAKEGSTIDWLEGFYMNANVDQAALSTIEDWQIVVQVDAIQADGFATVQAAFLAFDAD